MKMMVRTRCVANKQRVVRRPRMQRGIRHFRVQLAPAHHGLAEQQWHERVALFPTLMLTCPSSSSQCKMMGKLVAHTAEGSGVQEFVSIWKAWNGSPQHVVIPSTVTRGFGFNCCPHCVANAIHTCPCREGQLEMAHYLLPLQCQTDRAHCLLIIKAQP